MTWGSKEAGNATLMTALASRVAICVKVTVNEPNYPFLLDVLEMRLEVNTDGVVIPAKDETLTAVAIEEPSEKKVKSENGNTGCVVGGLVAAFKMEKVRLVSSPAAEEGKGLLKVNTKEAGRAVAVQGVDVAGAELTISWQLLLAIERSKLIEFGKWMITNPPTGMGF